MRTKVIPIPEVFPDFVISPLSVDQVHELVLSDSGHEKALSDGGVAIERAWTGRNSFRDRVAPVVAASLNNVATGGWKWFSRPLDQRWIAPRLEGDPAARNWWTAERVMDELDFGEQTELNIAILNLTGLNARSETRGASKASATPGEPIAAATS